MSRQRQDNHRRAEATTLRRRTQELLFAAGDAEAIHDAFALRVPYIFWGLSHQLSFYQSFLKQDVHRIDGFGTESPPELVPEMF